MSLGLSLGFLLRPLPLAIISLGLHVVFSMWVCVLFSFLQDYPLDKLRAHPKDLILANPLFEEPVSKHSLIRRCWQLALQHMDLGGDLVRP